MPNKIVTYALTALASGMGIAVLLVIGVWIIFRPSGNVSAYVELLDESSRKHAERIFSDAQPIAHRMMKDWGFVAEVLGEPNSTSALEQKYSDNASISDALEIDFQFEVSEGGFTTEMKFQIEPILNQLYSVMGWHDFDLVFFSFSEENEKYAADVQLRPIQSDRVSFPVSGHINSSELSTRIAEYTVGQVSGSSVSLWNPFDAALKYETVKNLRHGYYLMYLGGVAEECSEASQTQDCSLALAKESFSMADESGDDHGLADFGIGIASLKQAKRAMERGQSEYDVADLFVEAIVSLVRSTKLNSRLNEKFLNQDFDGLLDLDEIEALDLSIEFIETAPHFLEAYAALKPADYETVLRELSNLKRVPRPIKGIVESIEISAKLYLGDKASAGTLLEQLARKELRGLMRPWLWHYTNAFFHCMWSEDHPERIVIAKEHIDLARRNLPRNSVDQLANRLSEAQIDIAEGYCLALDDDSDGARRMILRLQENGPANSGNDERRIVSTSLLGIAEILVALGEFEEADQAISQTLEFDAEWEPFVQRSKLFSEYNKWKGQRK